MMPDSDVPTMISTGDFRRLETKVDKLTDAVQRFLVVEDRLIAQGERMGKLETDIGIQMSHNIRIERKLDQWINRGIGAWAVAAVIFFLLEFGAKIFIR
jgi:hypothetical protein